MHVFLKMATRRLFAFGRFTRVNCRTVGEDGIVQLMAGNTLQAVKV